MMPEASPLDNCKSSVLFRANARPDRFISSRYREACCEREGENDPIGTEDRIIAMNSHSSREYVQGILFISRAELESGSWRLLACTHLVIFISGSSFCKRIFTNIGAARFPAGLDVSPSLEYEKRNCEPHVNENDLLRVKLP